VKEQDEPLDGIAREVETQLRDLRRLVAEEDTLTNDQDALLNSIKELLYKVHTQAIDLRHSLTTGLPPLSVFYALEDKPVTGAVAPQTDAERELAELEKRLGMGKKPTAEDSSSEGLEGGSGVPAVPTTPPKSVAGGAARTFAEAEEPPRNP
jgi:hypothetical protein